MTDATPARTDLDDFLGAPVASPWKRRIRWTVLAVGLLVLLLLLSRCFRGDDTPSYTSLPVREGPLTVTVSATGKLAPTNEVTVGSEQSGLIERVLVDNNDQVRQGQPLAQVDPARLDDAVTRSQAALTAAEASVEQAKATEAEAQASVNRLREVSRLSGGKVPAKTEMDTALAALARARAGVSSADANVVSARAQLSSDMTNRARAIIRSPVNGVVLSRQVEPGQTVAASFNTPTLFTIAEDLTRMKLEVSIDEADVGQVHAGQSAQFTVDAYPGRTFPAKITRVDLGANTGSSSSSSTSGSTTTTSSSTVVAYTAVLEVANPDKLLRPGMTATAEILVDQKNQALLVPNAALRFTPPAESAGGQRGGLLSSMSPGPPRGMRAAAGGDSSIGAGARRTLYLLGSDGQPRPVSVVTGATDGQNTAITGGDLKPGMRVITGLRAPARD